MSGQLIQQTWCGSFRAAADIELNLMRPRVVFVDVDDTLVRSVGSKRIPMPDVVARVRRLHADGATLYLWSSGGAEYARDCATELGLEGCFAGYLPKPDVYLDDQPVHEWRYCKHVLPGNAHEV
ncbi:DUF705 domain-containing protein [Ramlibacter sp. MMS24-I3-19]|uniref:DUF705 domain-containing protein n=1 Tax=Ramlibacter sp. MMS24-I3-19 TaxID=3416606 RepID=UPI003D0225A0